MKLLYMLIVFLSLFLVSLSLTEDDSVENIVIKTRTGSSNTEVSDTQNSPKTKIKKVKSKSDKNEFGLSREQIQSINSKLNIDSCTPIILNANELLNCIKIGFDKKIENKVKDEVAKKDGQLLMLRNEIENLKKKKETFENQFKEQLNLRKKDKENFNKIQLK